MVYHVLPAFTRERHPVMQIGPERRDTGPEDMHSSPQLVSLDHVPGINAAMAAIQSAGHRHLLVLAVVLAQVTSQVINISPYNIQIVASDNAQGCLARSATTATGSPALTFEPCTSSAETIAPEQLWQMAPQTPTATLLISAVDPYLCLASPSFTTPQKGSPALLQRCNPKRLEQLWVISSANVTSIPNNNQVPVPVLINTGVQSGVCMSACNDDTTTACVYNSKDNLTWCEIPSQVNLRLSINGANVQDIVMPAPTSTSATSGPGATPTPTPAPSPGGIPL